MLENTFLVIEPKFIQIYVSHSFFAEHNNKKLVNNINLYIKRNFHKISMFYHHISEFQVKYSNLGRI